MQRITFALSAILIIFAAASCQPESKGSGGGGGGGGGSGLQVLTSSLPTCGFNDDYLESLAAAGGVTPYSWSLVSGTLPGNMDITIAGEFVGNPLHDIGAFAFRVRVTDATMTSAEGDLVLTVDPPPPGPIYYGEPVVSQRVFLIDTSSAAATVDPGKTQSRLQRAIGVVQTELAGLNAPYDKFEILTYGGGTSRCFGSLQYNTSGIAALAQAFLAALTPAGDAATYSALRSAYLDYGTELWLICFAIASAPGADAGAPGGQATYANILSDSPSWMATQPNANLAVLDTVGSGTQPSFAQQLAALAGGTYTLVP